jgi:MerR family transcriptional regulator, mercuric resistance operon regulatory protein
VGMTASGRLKIGELARRAGCTVKTVRFYEAKGLLPAPPRSLAGYRLYEERHLRCLQLIQRSKRLGLSLAKIRTLVVHLGAGPRPGARLRPHLERLLRDELKGVVAKLDQLDVVRAELEALLARIHGADGALPLELCVCATAPPRRNA